MGLGQETSVIDIGLRYKSELVAISRGELESLRWKANYYESQFKIKKSKVCRVIAHCRQLKAAKKKLWKRLFGRKSESGQGGGGRRRSHKGDRGCSDNGDRLSAVILKGCGGRQFFRVAIMNSGKRLI